MLHDHDSSICIGEVDVGADLSRSTHCSCIAELAQGQTFGPWELIILAIHGVLNLIEVCMLSVWALVLNGIRAKEIRKRWI